MIVSTFALMVAAAGAASAPARSVDDLSGLFLSACLDGQATLGRGQATAIAFSKLPEVLRRRLASPTSGRVWRLNTAGHSYLYVLDYAPGLGNYPRLCGLASDQMKLDDAGDALELRIAGSVFPGRPRARQWWRAADGYNAIATRAAEFSVVQVNWLSDAERRAALAETKTLAR